MAAKKKRIFPLEPIVVPTRLIRAAQACSSPGDVRRLLQGVCLRTDGFVQGTNGAVAFFQST